MPDHDATIELYWIPLGAGGHSVRLNGKVYEALAAARSRRERYDLYHAALVVSLDGERYTIEVAPSPDTDDEGRGVVATGAVGSRWAGWLRLFRYEVRCWPGGSIPDLRRDPRQRRRHQSPGHPAEPGPRVLVLVRALRRPDD